MVSMLASSASRRCESQSGQIKDNELGICCLSVKQAAVRSKKKYWLVRNRINVSECSDTSTRTVISVS